MVILNATFPAGMTIDEAIGEALDLSEELSKKVNVMLECDMNDVKVGIVAGLLPREKAIKYYSEQYQDLLSMKHTKGMNI